jgi:hypothetical protein
MSALMSEDAGVRFRYSYWKLAVIAVISAVMLRLLIMSLSAAVFQHWNWRGWKWQVESYLVVLGPTVASVLGLTRRRIESVCLTDTGIALRAGRPLQSVVIPWSAVDRAEVRFRWLLARLDPDSSRA